MIVNFNELKEMKKQKERVVMGFLMGYYKNMQDSSGKIHSSRDLKIVYDKVLKTGKL